MEPLELVRWVALIRLAFDLDDFTNARRLTDELHGELMRDLLASPTPRETQSTEAEPASSQGRTERAPGPPWFTLILAGETESRIRTSFAHAPCTDSEYERLLDWLGKTSELGPLLDAALSGPPS